MKQRIPASSTRRQVKSRLSVLVISTTGLLASLFLIGLLSAQATSGPSLLQQKQQILQQQQKDIATARARIGPFTRKPAPSTLTPEPLHPGIIQTHQGPFPPSFFLVQSLWQGPIGKDWVLAFAGGKPGSNGTVQQGAMLLYTVIRDQRGFSTITLIGMFPAPNTSTSLHIVSVQGHLLQLQSESGVQSTFDLQTHQYGS